jgi:hypothetical protein
MARAAAAAPGLPAKAREEMASGYEDARAHKAQALSVEPAGSWRTGDRPTAENAEDAALENCQLFYGHPCVLIAVDGVVQPQPPGDRWPRRVMPRVAYAGAFDPAQIPGVAPGIRERTDILKYHSAPAPKAAALTPRGDRMFTVVGAANQRAAEEEALRQCNAEPIRRQNTACFLYAAADRVVLALRLTAPLSGPETPAASPPPAASTPAAAAAVPLREALSTRLASVVPSLPAKMRANAARFYKTAPDNKAQVASLEPAGLWRTAQRPSAEDAEMSALESCQIAHGQPCVLLAVNDTLQAAPPDDKWPRRDMVRARYAGLFDPEQIPGSLPGMRRRGDVINYRSARSPKAAAFTPNRGKVFIVTGAASQRAAEEEVLKACDEDPIRKTDNGICFLYAVGDQVVLPRRLKEPLSATPPR